MSLSILSFAIMPLAQKPYYSQYLSVPACQNLFEQIQGMCIVFGIREFREIHSVAFDYSVLRVLLVYEMT